MRVLLTGATSLPGLTLLKRLLECGHDVRCLMRSGSPNLMRLKRECSEIVHGDAGNEASLVRALPGMDAVAHVAGLTFAPQVVAAMRRSGVDRLLAVGSTSVHSAYEHRSGHRKEMEKVVRGSGLAWTVVRPTMIYGSELDRNMRHLLRFLDRFPIFPLFGDGTNLWQPVYHEDLARGMLAALERPEAVGRSYDLPGAAPLTYRDLVLTAAGALGRKPQILKLPLGPVRQALAFAERARLPLPVKSEQVLRLREDKAYPYDEAREELGYKPRPFHEGIALEVARLREVGMVRP
ncbi:MAG: NAD-dependent epimerase/dehydratase family protein [Rubrobacteraceae bacterium]|nr:NAD(P)H-binding protein [Rubrobacter sp.]